ncbi:MAG: NADH-quinone oxidoreductase subunit J [Chloroflexota bacterium]
MGLEIAFWVLAVVGVVAALAVVFLQNVFRAALMLMLGFLAIAGLYVTLSADFLAVVQVLVYVGGISVLIILAIMLTRDVQRGSPANKLQVPAFLVSGLLLAVIIMAVLIGPWTIASLPPQTPTTAALAAKLLSPDGFILAVEISAVLILAAVLGAIVMVREK